MQSPKTKFLKCKSAHNDSEPVPTIVISTNMYRISLRLDLSHCTLSTVGLVSIANALPFCRLRELRLFGNHFVPQSADAFRDALLEVRQNLLIDFEALIQPE